MALVGKTERRGHVSGRGAMRQHMAGTGQAQLDQISVWRNSEGGLEGARQPVTVHAAGGRQIIESDVFVHVVVQVIACALGNQRQARIDCVLRAPAQILRQPRQQVVERGLPHDAQFGLLQYRECAVDSVNQLGFSLSVCAKDG